jgi:hypothetical protein
MGRRAKYHTAAEQNAAAKARKKKYAESNR